MECEEETAQPTTPVDNEGDASMSHEEEEQDNVYPEGWETVRPKKKVEKQKGLDAPPPPPPRNPLDIRSDQEAAEAVSAWDLNSVNSILKLCEQRLQNSKAAASSAAASSSKDKGERGETPLSG